MMLKRITEALLDLIYPRVCITCQKTLQDTENFVCGSCQAVLPYVKDSPLFEEKNRQKLAGRVLFASVQSLLIYQRGNNTQRIIKEIKYRGNQELALWIGKYAGERFKNEWLPPYDVLVPIPIHPKKLSSRGYNQAAAIAEGLGDRIGVPVLDGVLRRTIHTASQTTKNRMQRYENMRNVYEILQPELVRGKCICLVDDVLTTGATIEVAAEKLLAAGATEVGIMTIASAY